MRVKSTFAWLLGRFFLCLFPVTSLLSGCQIETVRLSVENAASMKGVMLVALETPPLEVIPDLLETRQPVIRSLETMEISVYSEPALYRYPGGILIFGQSVSDDNIDKLADSDTLLTRGNTPFSNEPKFSQPWLPTQELVFRTAELLSKQGMKVIFNGMYRHLSLNSEQRQSHLSHWHDAIAQWYEEKISPIDYTKLATTPVDAVIEVGINDFRIFEGQINIQVLMKVIEPKSGRVLAKTGNSDYVNPSFAETLLLPDGSAFKQLISKMGIKLIESDFKSIGLYRSAGNEEADRPSEMVRHD